MFQEIYIYRPLYFSFHILDVGSNYLWNNYTGQKVPLEISSLGRLRFLDLGSNYLENPNWSMFAAMPLLTHLNFGFNPLKGEFPSFVLKCRNLTLGV